MTKDSDSTKEVKEVVKKLPASNADKIWERIANLPIEMFALPDQKVSDHLDRVQVPGDNLLVRPKSPAVVAALDGALGKGYVIEVADKGYLVISDAPQTIELKDEYVSFPRPNGKVDKIPRKKIYNS